MIEVRLGGERVEAEVTKLDLPMGDSRPIGLSFGPQGGHQPPPDL